MFTTSEKKEDVLRLFSKPGCCSSGKWPLHQHAIPQSAGMKLCSTSAGTKQLKSVSTGSCLGHHHPQGARSHSEPDCCGHKGKSIQAYVAFSRVKSLHGLFTRISSQMESRSVPLDPL